MPFIFPAFVHRYKLQTKQAFVSFHANIKEKRKGQKDFISLSSIETIWQNLVEEFPQKGKRGYSYLLR